MADAVTITKKARAEVDNVVDELVQTIQNGVSQPDGSEGFEPSEAERLRAHLRELSEAIIGAARGDDRREVDTSIAEVVETIRNGVVHPAGSAGFGTGEADELRASLRMFAGAIVTAAGSRTRTEIDPAMDQVVRSIRSGLFLVYGRASYAAITADQLEAYLETFADAVLTVVEKESPRRVSGTRS